jgi:hypothetical protein
VAGVDHREFTRVRDSRILIGMALAATIVVAALVVGASKPPRPAPAASAVTPPRPGKAFVQSAAAAAESAEVATTPPTRVIGVARGGATPKLQPPAATLTFERFQDAFNADAGAPRLLVMLSPT